MLNNSQSTLSTNRFANLTFAILIWLALESCSRPEATFVLLFEHRTEEIHQLYSVRPDGSGLIQVSDISKGDVFWLSPKGEKLAVLNWAGELTISDIATKEVLAEINNVGQGVWEGIPYYENLAWSPSENALAFLTNSAGMQGTDITAYSLITKTAIQLTNDEAIERALAWSPDGESIAFVASSVCNRTLWNCSAPDVHWDLVTIKPNGTGRQVLISFQDPSLQAGDIFRAIGSNQLCSLSWSPDSKYIAFEDGCDYLSLPTDRDVFVTPINSPRLSQLTDFTESIDDSLFTYSIQWSNTSGKLYIGYTVEPYGPPGTNQASKNGVAVIDVDNLVITDLSGLTDVSGNTVRLSLNEKLVAWRRFSDNLRGEAAIGTLNNNRIDTITVSGAPAGTCRQWPIQWSPNNQYIAYTLASKQSDYDDCVTRAERGLVIVNSQNGEAIDVTSSLGGDNRPLGWFPEAAILP
jgi:dipeptidyl aminopeptidase/acylaminoacyl peptidase